ncbi:MAG: hypothetical protein WCT26_01285 [Candidatus Buchananbacteria bacterium]|jgi:hypothetical protein
MLQSTRYKIIIYCLISAILLALLGFWIYFAKAQARDYQRLADLRVWQNILSDYYSQNGTYKIPNCDNRESLSVCLGDNINDPKNFGSYQYSVASLSDTDYEINFSLEAGIGGLRPGQYIWTKNGVKK